MADNETLITRGPSLVRWGAVFAGVVAGFGMFVLLTTLWIAWAWNDLGGAAQRPSVNNAWVQNNLEWLIAVFGVLAMLLAGFTAGWFAGLRGTRRSRPSPRGPLGVSRCPRRPTWWPSCRPARCQLPVRPAA